MRLDLINCLSWNFAIEDISIVYKFYFSRFCVILFYVLVSFYLPRNLSICYTIVSFHMLSYKNPWDLSQFQVVSSSISLLQFHRRRYLKFFIEFCVIFSVALISFRLTYYIFVLHKIFQYVMTIVYLDMLLFTWTYYKYIRFCSNAKLFLSLFLFDSCHFLKLHGFFLFSMSLDDSFFTKPYDEVSTTKNKCISAKNYKFTKLIVLSSPLPHHKKNHLPN